MNQKRSACRMGLCLLLLGTIGLFGCIRSIYPILKEDQVIHDESLAGDWITSDGKYQLNARPESKIGEDLPAIIPDIDFAEGKTRIPQWGYRVVVNDPEAGFQVTAFRVRLGKVGQMTIAEYSLSADQWRPPGNPNTPGLDMMIRPLYSFAQVEFVTPDHLRVSTINPDWMQAYLTQHPDELQLLNKDSSMPELVSKTEEIQTFLLKNANTPGAWKVAGELVRSGDPATQPGASSQPADVTTQPADATTQPATKGG